MPTTSPIEVDSVTGEVLDAGDGDSILAEDFSYAAAGISIDDVRFFGEVPDEATALGRARRELEGDEAAEALLYLRFEEGEGVTAYDSSGHGRDATLSGTTQWVGFDGGPELVGVRKPTVRGIKRRRAGKKIDSQRLVWQVNALPCQSIVPDEAGFVTLAYAGDFPSIYDWVPVAGQYATQLSRGLVRFATEPVKPAFDVEGYERLAYPYSAATAHLMRGLFLGPGGLTESQVDLAAVALVALARPDAAGIATGDSPVSVASLLNTLAEGMDGWWLPDRAGRGTLGVREEPVLPEAVLGPDDVLEAGVRRVATAPAVYQWVLSYRDYEVTLEEADVSASVPAGEKADLNQKERWVETPRLAVVQRRHADARQARGATNYDDKAAARREGERRLALDRHKRDVYQAPLSEGLFQHRAGQVLALGLDRYSLVTGASGTGPWAGAVGGYEEAIENDQRKAVLSLWGKHIPEGAFVGTALLTEAGGALLTEAGEEILSEG